MIYGYLKPCPFCGNEEPVLESVFQSLSQWRVQCGECSVKTDKELSPFEAEAAWNRRTPCETTKGEKMKILIEIEVPDGFEKSLEQQTIVESEIANDRWSWKPLSGDTSPSTIHNSKAEP